MSIQAEQSVLGGILMKPESFWLVADLLAETDFSTGQHRAIWIAVREMLTDGQPVDVLTVPSHDKRINGADLIDLASNTPSAANVRAYAEIVAKASEQRRLKVAGTRIASAQTFAEAQQILADVRPQNALKLSTMKTAAKAMHEEMMARYDSEQELSGVPTTIAGLDDMLGGFRAGRLYVLAGRPGSGKSVYANQLAVNSGRVYLSTLEMSQREIAERAAANIGNFPYRWITHPKETEEVWPRMTAVMPKILALETVIDDSSGITADVICARIRQAHMAKPLTVAIIDHLGQISRQNKNDASELGLITTQLKGLAKDLQIPIVLLAQLNRKVEDRGGDFRPKMSDLRDSGRIEEDADVVILAYRPEYHKIEPMGFVEFIVAKNRSGVTGSAWALSRLANMRLESCGAPDYQPQSKVASRGFTR
jgi:replicative DNA helicase